MYAHLHRAASIRGAQLRNQNVLGTLDAACEMRPGGLQAGDVPLHDLRYTLLVHNDLQVCVGRASGSGDSCGAVFFDSWILPAYTIVVYNLWYYFRQAVE